MEKSMRSFSYLFTLLWTLSLPVNATSTASSTAITTTVTPSLGLMHLRTTDESRRHWSGTGHRPLALDRYYPTISPDVSHWSTMRFNHGYVARQAPRMQKKHPLILLSHGSRSHAGQLLWLIEPLVQAGFIVAAVNHHGNTSREPTFYDAAEQLWWERAADLQAVAFLKQHIDQQQPTKTTTPS
jgi:hypothetical protein